MSSARSSPVQVHAEVGARLRLTQAPQDHAQNVPGDRPVDDQGHDDVQAVDGVAD